MKQVLQLRLHLCSDTIFGSGASIPGGEDIALRTDSAGYPLLAGSTLKGLLRESVTDLLCWTDGDSTLPGLLFGSEGWTGEDSRRVIFSDLRLENPPADLEACTALRTFTALENGIVREGTLRVASCLRGGLTFTGVLLCEEQDVPLLCQAAKGIKWVGLLRHRGFGRVTLAAAPEKALPARPPVEAASLLRYRLRLVTPLSVPWHDRSCAPGETLNSSRTRTWLPGSAVRGMVCSQLAQQEPDWFAAHKQALLEQTAFSDALPLLDGAPSLPTPKGFYADKAGTRFYSVLENGEVQPGDKRAPLAPFCTAEDHTLHTGSPVTVTAIRSARTNRDMFTVQRLEAGQELEGTIALPDPALAPQVAAAFGQYVWLGADRYAGSGLCQVMELAPADAPFWTALGYQPGDAVPQTLYMMAVSPLCMEQDGLPCELDEVRLAAALGVDQVEMALCSTSLTESVGFNRTWGCELAALPMYESGSMFKLRCTPAPTAEALARVQREGLGLRRAEGCGQVLFWKDFLQLRSATADKAAPAPKNTAPDRVRRARCRWLLENRVPGGLSKSQLGSLQAECERAMAQNGDTRRLMEFFDHNEKERGAHHGDRFKRIRPRVEQILNTPLHETLGGQLCAGEVPDSTVERLRLLCDWFDLSRKEKGGDRT